MKDEKGLETQKNIREQKTGVLLHDQVISERFGNSLYVREAEL